MASLTQAAIEEAFNDEDAFNWLTTRVVQDIVDDTYDIAVFVDKLGFALTSPTVDLRVNGTRLLSATLAQLPKTFLNATQLQFLTTFYADRLKDHHNVIPTVIDGIDALIQMQHLPSASVPQLLRSFFQHTTCQSQMRSDRAKLFKIFCYLSETYAAELKSMSGDFVYNLINSIDGERDPRNLDYIFSFMPSFIANFPLLHLTEEMFEIFACYFPIDFNPYKNEPDTITRDRLAVKLTDCLVATPDFAEWTVPLALEKLESDLTVAKLDSLELLRQAALKFPPQRLESHFESIWTALKIEIFPGKDNFDIVSAGLGLLRTILERAASDTTISQNYQTQLFGVILPHLSDATHRLFEPATAIGLVCVSGDPKFASNKILNTFLLKLEDTQEPLNDEQRTRIYTIIAQIFKIIYLRGSLEEINVEVCTALQSEVIACLCRQEEQMQNSPNLDVKRSALSMLNECTPIISEANRALLYKVLVQLLSQDDIDLDFRPLLERLGALYPIELQTNCIDVCIRNFPIFSHEVKRRIYTNLLPLVKQIAFTQTILDFVLTHIFQSNISSELRLLALEALNSLLEIEDARFIEDLQHSQSLIEKLINLSQAGQLDSPALERVAATLSQIVQQLSHSEQYMIVTQYLPKLNLQLEADLYVSKGLLGFLHQDLSLDDHFERLLDDLTKLSLESDNPHLRQVAHHLLCSLVNKIDYNERNRSTLAKVIVRLKEAIKKGDAKAVEALSWLAKGLIVRGCEDAGDIVEALAELLDHPSLKTAASLAFEIISVEFPQLHLPVAKYLYKQKFFHMMLSKLGHKLTEYCEHHMNAFIYVLKATPHAVLKMNIEKVGPVLFKSLESTQVHTLCISLGICDNFIKHQDEYFRGHLNHIIPSCLQLSQYKQSMQVRITALNLLHDIIKYPIFVLLPHKMDVVLELATALDDPKRLVRNAAVRARNAWFLIGAPKAE